MAAQNDDGILMIPVSQAIRQEFDAMRKDITQIENAVTKLAEAIDRLTRLEEQHSSTREALTRAFDKITLHERRHAEFERRFQKLEKSDHVQNITSRWVMSAVWGAAGLLAMYVLKTIGIV